MARHSEDFYWTDEQRTFANNYLKELNEVQSDYERKKRELLEARREYIYKQLLASRTFRKYGKDLQTSIVDSINDAFRRKIEEQDEEFFCTSLKIEP
jgi:predicted transcriptional regulator